MVKAVHAPACRLLAVLALLLAGPRATATDELQVRLAPVVAAQARVPLTLALVGSGTIAAVQLPTVDGITLAVAPAAEQSDAMAAAGLGGRRSLVVDLTVAAPGDYVIPGIPATLDDGSVVASAPQRLRCRPSDRGELAWAQVRFDPPQVVVGERTRLIYLLALRADLTADESAVAPPDQAVRIDSVPRQRAHAERDADGHPWVVHQLVWTLTFPSPGTFQAGGEQELQRRDLDQHSMLTVRPGVVAVDALPDGAPADFQGQIGAVELDATLEPPRITTDQGALLALRISGGQELLRVPPSLGLPPGLHAYRHGGDDECGGDQPEGATMGDEEAPMAGSRTFRWDILPLASGISTITVPGVPYFDPLSRRYGRSQAISVTLAVLPGRPQRALAPDPAAGDDAALGSLTAALPLGPSSGSAPGPLAVVLLALAGLSGCLVLALAPAWVRRRHRPGATTYRRLREALARGEAEAAAQALAQLRHEAPVAARRHLDQLAPLIDLARFGRQPLDPAALTLADALQAKS